METVKKLIQQIKELFIELERVLINMGGEVTIPKPPAKARLAIIVGHSNADGGANGYFPSGKIQEYKFYREHFVPFMVDEAKKLGLEHQIFLRDGTDIGGVGSNVSKWSNANTVAIELHFNSYNGTVRGSEVLYDSQPAGNKAFASLIQSIHIKVLERSGTGDRKAKLTDTGRGAHNLTSVKCIGCLVEPAFCDNKEDATLLWDKREELAREFVRAAAGFIV